VKIGFDNEKYLALQAEHIRQRMSQFGGKLYLEFGGKLFDDYHASRVLPGFQPDSKIRMLETIRDDVEIVIAICAGDIEKNKTRGDLGIGYDQDVLRLIDVFRRVSVGWKDVRRTDGHYREGDGFHLFSYGGIRFATALCGDLWTPGRPEELAALGADAVLWPVWCDYPAAEWNEQVKLEYAAQASRCGCPVLYVNPFCVDPDAPDAAAGGAACFSGGRIVCEAPAGESGILFVEL
jgi:hypothetical protein